ncbi:general odorant-binding protein 69a [Microplitis demolitor]|uniref:general odorant-binding protein 69a n=1 Tax=Microplitis demolitor TaxID=69319 RepID=UPI0004CDA675|nr:general odorant-binding protein 69a [Microplitis demolitor]
MAKFLLSIVSVLVLIAYAQSGPVPEEFKEVQPTVRAACVKESGITSEDLINKAAVGEFTDDPQLKCYLKCLLDQFRLVSKNGINFDAMLALSPPSMKEDATKMIKECRDTKGKEGDLCDLAFEATKCLYNSNPEKYFIL